MQLQVLDPHAAFACSSCGWCCDQPWATVISAEDAARYDAIDWGAESVALREKKLYRKVKRNGNITLELTKSSGNRCIFLDDDNRCLVHSKLGLDAKPHMCKQFPYLPVTTPTRQRVSLNYGCKAVQRHSGPALSAQQKEIDRVIRQPAGNRATQQKIKLSPDIDMPVEVGEKLIAHLGDFFDPQNAVSVMQCFAWCLDLLEFAGNCEPDEFCSRLNSAGTVPARREHGWKPDESPALAPMPARMLFAATLYPDLADPNDLGLLKRFTLIPKLLSVTQMRGSYASRILARNVHIGGVFSRNTVPLIAPDANALLKRYFRSRLWQHLPTGGRLPIISGIHQHILDLTAILMYAHVERGSDGANVASSDPMTLDPISRGLNIVEFHLANQERLTDKVLQSWFAGALASLPVARAALGMVRAQGIADSAISSASTFATTSS